MIFDLDDPRALDPLVAGVKAARLAAARRAGLPVLDGVIVSASEATAAMAAGGAEVEEGRPGYARTAARQAPTDGDLTAAVELARRLGPLLVVRSSSRLDDDGRWAGAFATFGDVRPDEVETAIRGCWAWVFAPAALERFKQARRRPVDAGLAVLIQPQVRPDAGGWAVVRGSGAEIAAVTGPPGPLLGGWVAGERVTINASSIVSGSTSLISADDTRAIAALLYRVSDEFGADRIEWASIDGSLVLFQLVWTADPIEQDLLDGFLDPGTRGYPSFHGVVSFCDLQGSLRSLRRPLFYSGFRTPPEGSCSRLMRDRHSNQNLRRVTTAPIFEDLLGEGPRRLACGATRARYTPHHVSGCGPFAKREARCCPVT